jgi:hypothetical protein
MTGNSAIEFYVTVIDVGLARLKFGKKHEHPRCGNDQRNDERGDY